MSNNSKPYTDFPEDFLWGSATASYQVEGAAAIDGRTPSIWDTFSKTPGKVINGDTGDIACDQYHRYRDDTALMADLNIKAYRFSFSWSRILPEKNGPVNQKGLDYYKNLCDSLLEKGISPWATLFHWDLPQYLQDDYNGWQSRETPEHFGRFAEIIAKEFGDRIKNYFTVNEIYCFTDLSHIIGHHAPGLQLKGKAANQVRHHGVLAHGLAAQALRQNTPEGTKIGLADNAWVTVPVYDSPEHAEAAKNAFRIKNGGIITPIMEGAYPDTFLEDTGNDAPDYTDDEMKAINTPLDFVGMNMYNPVYVKADPQSPRGYSEVALPPTYPHMDISWLAVGPQITYWGPKHLKDLWNVQEIYITENGCCCQDQVNSNGEVEDIDRVFYLREHFHHLSRGIKAGNPVKGYFLWSLLDNFEWAEGYAKRFGIIYVDYKTQKRIPKLSAQFYRDVIAGGNIL